MYIIIGLGNPTKKYDNTRHNAGFCVVDKIAKEYDIPLNKEKFKAVIGEGHIKGKKVLLVKPLTYMNLSGESLSSILKFYKFDEEEAFENVVIVYDDITLDVGKIKIKVKGSAGGHNGIKSIISHLGSTDFMRVKLGIGKKPPQMKLADYVLSKFLEEEMSDFEKGVDSAANSVVDILSLGVNSAMNKWNIKEKPTVEATKGE